jgi:uncharacterized delta-60 repeat protein
MYRYIHIYSTLFAFLIPLIGSAQIWVARYNGPDNGWDGGNRLVVDNAGNVYVTGSSDGGSTLYDFATIKYDASGTAQWIRRYNGPGNGGDEAGAIFLDDDGNVYIAGYSQGSGTGSDYATIKYNNAGEEQWVARYNGPGNIGDGAGGIVVDDSGNVYVTGYSVGAGTESDYATIKYNSSGIEQWVARYNGPSNSHDRAIAIALDNSGNICVTGTSWDANSGDDYVTIKYDPAGFEQWAVRYDGAGNDFDGARALVIDDSDNIYVTGTSWGVGTNEDYATVKYDPSGVQQWVARYNGTGNDWDHPRGIVVDSYSNIYITGWSMGDGTWDDCATIKYNSAGVQQWVSRFNGATSLTDYARAIALDNDGNVYITGFSVGAGSGDDYITIKYNNSGVEQWVERYNGPATACDDALAVAVDNAGYVYVTGWSRGIDIGFDFATIKYSATGIDESHITRIDRDFLHATIFSGPLILPENRKCTVFDITGRSVSPDQIKPGVYFIETHGVVTQKVIKIK